MTDAELSLAVARIMWPEYEWKAGTYIAYPETLEDEAPLTFDYSTDDALGKMVVWLATNTWPHQLKKQIVEVLLFDDRHKAIAEAILEVSDD